MKFLAYASGRGGGTELAGNRECSFNKVNSLTYFKLTQTVSQHDNLAG